MARTQSEKFCRNALECRRKAQEAAKPEDEEAWLKLADDWSKLAQAEAPKKRMGGQKASGSFFDAHDGGANE
jgi:hypothetical protein